MSSEALRLADELDAEVVRTVSLDVTHSKAASLLRTQAARIASLEAERDQLRAEVERLRKPLTDEQIKSIRARPGCWEHVGERIAFCYLPFARAIEAAKEA